MRVALVSREVHPLRGGGIGQYVTSAARLLSDVAEVTIVTKAEYAPEVARLRAAGDARLPPASVRFAFVPEPEAEEAAAWEHVMHCYSARALDCLKTVYGDRPPDLIEFPDFLGEAFVTVQAAETHDPFLAATRICVRLHTTHELTEVLNGCYRVDRASRALHALERYSLARADSILWAGGDILGLYRRFYSDLGTCAVRIRHPFAAPPVPPVSAPAGSPLRLLYAGRLERRKGVVPLVRAVTGLDRDDIELTLIGGDTNTGPLGTSVRRLLELEIADDPRIHLRQEVDRAEVAAAISAHDVVVVPSRWECWPYAALEALHADRPILGTHVGGLTELIAPGHSGWLADSCDPAAIGTAIGALLDDRESVRALIQSGAPARHARGLSDSREIRDAYAALLRQPLPRARRRPGDALPHEPRDGHLVSAIVWSGAASSPNETLDSLRAQTHQPVEMILVDGRTSGGDARTPAEFGTSSGVAVVPGAGLSRGAAHNIGVAASRGRYVLCLDSDQILAPTFIERAVEILEDQPDVACVTSWSRPAIADAAATTGAGPGHQPLGNAAALLATHNVAGDTAVLLRRSLLDASSGYSDDLEELEQWELYRRFAAARRFGVVIPERLVLVRSRADGSAGSAGRRHDRLAGEVEARVRVAGVRWAQSPAAEVALERGD